MFECVAHHLVGEHPLMPGGCEREHPLLASRRVIDRFHPAMVGGVDAEIQPAGR